MPAPDDLAHAYASAAVGVVLSLTNTSPSPAEMLACGLPVVDLATDSVVVSFRPQRPDRVRRIRSAGAVRAIERLLDDLVSRADRARGCGASPTPFPASASACSAARAGAVAGQTAT